MPGVSSPGTPSTLATKATRIAQLRATGYPAYTTSSGWLGYPDEYVQHLAIFDFVAVSGSLDERVVEYVDHLHEHFVDPVVIRDGRYLVPEAPGYSITMQPASLERFAFPDGAAWSGSRDGAAADAGAFLSGARA